MFGVCLVDKPVGITSFQALSTIKKRLRTGKVGHTGTLDRFASGLLVVTLGAATRISGLISNFDKSYLATIRFGVETDTLDPEGVVTQTAQVPSLATIEAVLPRFVGRQSQVPPVFSAIHVGGRRASDLARSGRAPEMRPRQITIGELDVVAWHEPDLTVHVQCSKGTYIRALARDVARAGGTVGHLVALRRLRVGAISVDDAVQPADFAAESDVKSCPQWIESHTGMRIVQIHDAVLDEFRKGKPIRREWFVWDIDAHATSLVYSGDQVVGAVVNDDGGTRYRFVVPAPS